MGNEDKNIKSFLKPRKSSKYRQGYYTPKNPEKYRGRVPGSKEKTSAFLEKRKSKKIIEMLKNGNGVRSICRILQCSPNLVYKCKQASEELHAVKG